MDLFQLSKSSIRELCNPLVFKRGSTYFSEGNVEDLTWNEEKKFFSATVNGMETYDVHVHVSGERYAKKFYCSCPAYEKYTGICKHIVAVLFEIKEKKPHTFFHIEKKSEALHINKGSEQKRMFDEVDYMEKQKANAMIQSFQQVYMKKHETHHERETLDVEYILKLEPKMAGFRSASFELEMKVGPKRLYVVKDLKEFLRVVHQNETLKFAKHFSYDPSDYVLSEQDEAIFQWLWKLFHLRNEQDRVSSLYSYRSVNKEEKRKLDIPAPVVTELLDMLQTSNVVVDVLGMEYKGYEFVEGPLPLQFSIGNSPDHKGQFHFKWENEEEIAFFGSDYHILFYRGRFYALEGDQGDVIELLLNHLTKYDPAEITISQDQLENFASLVLPQLKKVGEVDVIESVREKIHMAPLECKLYVDYVDYRLTAELIFQYGDDKYSPFDSPQEYSGHVTVRDVEKELFILSHIEKVPFKYNGRELYLDDFDMILDFVMEDLPNLSNIIEVFTTSNVQGMVYDPQERPTIKVEANEKMNLLDVEFKMEGIPETEIDDILQALLDNKKYYRLANGSFLNLGDEELQEMRGMLDELELSQKDIQQHTKVPLMRAFQLSENNSYALKKGKAFRSLLERIMHPDEIETTVPEELDETLRDYQKIGFQWLHSLSHYGFGGVLADDMGLGKTLQMITYLVSQKQQGELGTTLIICPSSLVYNWQKEIERFAPQLSSVVISGSAEERNQALDEAAHKDVWITSYPLIRRDLEKYREKLFTTLILDEAQYVKNDWTQTAKAVKSIQAKQSFALSGTPIENSLNELYSIFDLVLPGLFKNKNAFKAMEQEKIAKRIRPFVLRRLKRDVLTELPDKMESVQYTELTDEQKKLYLAQLRLIRNDAKEAISAKAFQENRMKILAGLTRLRQICCHPALFMTNYKGQSGKMERLFEYLEEAIASGRRVVLFSQFTQMLSIIQDRLKGYGWQYHYLDGSTPSKERVELANQFNNGEKELFLVSLKAGGTGLNLTGGDTVILFDSWWNPAVEEQAADRVYRFGQKKVVQVTKLITTGTIEEKIHKLQGQKRELLDKVIQPGEKMITSLSKEDIEELLDI
ncbi:SNF2 helicase associated domain-containing protein [Evansella cellulosilytica]|uniref:SNF2-related protein n=1 Tax=Evansella cellulosilytica (strain ATCC 21833 / DSM 2522 / FERM P-1141 / JCM 9156 / N-4) TaxID=649639 RepID=E6U032_EVAC2|nr:SNF2 helicase associated domain-containing protein [Evansella cellulosilytica]ADU29036.1 SNF2-related protein [Evansella cellulosilytica DSM 2522]